MTARWVVDEVQPKRNLNITWQPISLLFKNKPAEDSDYYKPVAWSHGLLRVIESVRAAEGDDAVKPLYWEYGRRIHHDKNRNFAAAEALAAIGYDTKHAKAANVKKWDTVIRKRMDAGLALTGQDVGTPIIALDNKAGERVALFGPVITSVPDRKTSLQLWDGFVAVASVPGFWELKRTRTQGPSFGQRP